MHESPKKTQVMFSRFSYIAWLWRHETLDKRRLIEIE